LLVADQVVETVAVAAVVEEYDHLFPTLVDI
jgi:hypothetical protein